MNTSGTFSAVTLTGTANQISFANGNGTSGNPTASLTSTIQVSGISFDAGSNTLANYATGTFTPTISNSGTAPTVSYTTQLGRYTRVGNRVMMNIDIVLSAYTPGTGNAQISGLPFTSNNTSGNSTQGPIGLQNVTFGASVLWYVGVNPNGSTLELMSGMRSATTNLNLDATGPSATAIFKSTLVMEV